MSIENVQLSTDKDKFSIEKVQLNPEKVQFSTEKVKKSTEKVQFSTEKVKKSTEKFQFSTEKVKFSTEKVNKSSEKVQLSTENTLLAQMYSEHRFVSYTKYKLERQTNVLHLFLKRQKSFLRFLPMLRVRFLEGR